MPSSLCRSPATKPCATMRPRSAQVTSLQKRLAELAGSRLDLTRHDRWRAADGRRRRIHRRAAAQARARARRRATFDARRRRGRHRRGEGGRADVAIDVVRRPGRGVPPRRRPARRTVAGHAQRGHDARPVQDGLPGRDRRGLRADRLPAVQRGVRRQAAGRAAACRRRASGTSSTTGRSKASSTRSRRSTSPRSPATCPTSPGAAGQHGGLEAVADAAVGGALHRCGCSRRPACRPASSTW